MPKPHRYDEIEITVVEVGWIDYLFGVLEPGLPDANGNPTFHAFWARHEAGSVTFDAEKQAFQRVTSISSWTASPRTPASTSITTHRMSPAALGRLMGRHGTREDEVDRLLRGDVLIDLYRTVRQ